MVREGCIDHQVPVHHGHQVWQRVGGAQSRQQDLTHNSLAAALVTRGRGQTRKVSYYTYRIMLKLIQDKHYIIYNSSS